MNNKEVNNNKLTEYLAKFVFFGKFILYLCLSISVVYLTFITSDILTIQNKLINLEMQKTELEIKEKKFFMRLQEQTLSQSYDDIESGCSH